MNFNKRAKSNKKRSIFLLILLAVFSSLTLNAQKKFEKEVRIKKAEVHQNAIRFTQDIGFNKKVKWYKEYALKDTTIEAKIKHNSSIYSIEFNLAGKLEDIEHTIAWEEIPLSTRSRINEYFKANHDKKSIQKIQIQYTGNESELLSWMTQKSDSVSPTIKYEIVIHAKTDGKREMIEYLFSENGDIELKSVVVFKNSDNLEY